MTISKMFGTAVKICYTDQSRIFMTVKITTGIFLCVLVTLAGCATAKDAEMSEGTAKTLTSVTAYDTIGKNFSGGSVTITPDKPDALYSLGEECLFHAEIKDADGNVIPTGIAEVLIYSNYAMPVKMNIPFSPEQPLQIKASSLEPGFTAIEVRYPAGEKEFTSAGAGVGFAPGQLHPVSREPEDFDRFWNNAIAEQSKIPADMIITPLPEFDEPGYNAFRISFANINNTRIHGFMTIPSAPGKYPMFLSVPGAGPRDTRPVKLEEVDNLKAITVVLNVFPFELPTSYDAAEKLLAEHYNGNPSSYYKAEKDYRDFFFYRAIVGINRAVSELATHPKYNGKMVYWGSSQGGAMGVALTALNKNIDAMVVNVPSDFRKLFLRAEYASGDSGYLCYADYFSAENFARRITVPVLVSAGLIDFTCPPTTISRWFNILPSKDKKIVYIPGMGHDFDDNYQQLTAEFIAEHLEI